MLSLSPRRVILIALLLVAGCWDDDGPAGVTQSALNSCNVAADCPSTTLGRCVKQVCTAQHTCAFAEDTTACPTGCTVPTDCIAGCATPTCDVLVDGGSPECVFTNLSAVSCACTQASECTLAPTSCQNAPTCSDGTCTYTAKTGSGGAVVAGCCNAGSDCNTGATCTQATNSCTCGGGQRYCATGPSGCVTGTQCCANADCATGATCTDGTCTCPAGETYCPGTGCIPATGCCSQSDCAARANASVACLANVCVYTCDSGFHDCSGTCASDTSVQSCGTRCTACPTGNACQMSTCTAGACGLAVAGGSPCCAAPGDCVPMNACQTVAGCVANVCVFSATQQSGCCTTANDCPVSSDPCLSPTCVANQCASSPIPGCLDDGGTPRDMATPADLSAAADDLAVAPMPADDLAVPSPTPQPLSLTGGGGCDVAGGGAPGGAALLALVALTLAFRRRRHA